MASDFSTAFTAGTQSAITSILSAIVTPLLASVTVWIIIQGVLVMRGDIDTRGGITRIIRVSFVVGILTSSGLFNSYVQNLFITVIPNWAASIVNGGGTQTLTTPQSFDNMWSVTEHMIEGISQGLSTFDIIDAVSLVLIEIALLVLLVVTFAIYEFAIIVTGIIVAIGPVIIVGYLFESTKTVADRWIGKLITYSLLTLLINITLSIVLTGEKAYLRVILQGQVSNSGATAPIAIALQIKTLFELAMFFAMGAFIIVSLPAIAATIGGGHGGSPGAAVLNAITNIASGGASRAAKAVAPKPKS